MRIRTPGTVTITQANITVEGFLFDPEDKDPKDAPVESLALEAAVKWALNHLQNEFNKARLRAQADMKHRQQAAGVRNEKSN